MNKKELCEMCMEYSADAKCDYENSCRLQAILTENSKLKKENKKLKKELEALQIKISWTISPDMMGKA